MSARAAVYHFINRGRTPRQRERLVRVSHTITTAGLVSMIVDSSARLAPGLDAALAGVVIGVSAYFALMWAIRVWVAPEARGLEATSPHQSRRAYLVSPDGVIDLVAALALPLGWLAGLEQRDAQLLTIVWTLKYIRESAGLALMLRVMRRSLPALVSVVTVFLVVFLIAATFSYVFERGTQPETFGSIPHAMWWAIVTLTTTGYGDAVPATLWGRLLAGWVMVGGIVTFALWAGIIANAYTEELRRRDFLQTWDLVTRAPFFENLGAAATADIVRLLQYRDAAAETILIREGDPGDSMYFIVEGEITVLLKPHEVKLGPGAFFGEMALLFNEPRSATVVVSKPSVLLVLDVANFRELAGRRPELMDVIEAEGKRRRESNLASRS